MGRLAIHNGSFPGSVTAAGTLIAVLFSAHGGDSHPSVRRPRTRKSRCNAVPEVFFFVQARQLDTTTSPSGSPQETAFNWLVGFLSYRRKAGVSPVLCSEKTVTAAPQEQGVNRAETARQPRGPAVEQQRGNNITDSLGVVRNLGPACVDRSANVARAAAKLCIEEWRDRQLLS